MNTPSNNFRLPAVAYVTCIQKLHRCRTFVQDPAPAAQLNIGAYTLTKLKRCFSVFKAMVLDGGLAIHDGDGGGVAQTQGNPSTGEGGHDGAMIAPGERGSGELGGQVRCATAALTKHATIDSQRLSYRGG